MNNGNKVSQNIEQFDTEQLQLQRLKDMIDQIENEVVGLQDKHIEICKRIKNLNGSEPFHSLSVLIGEE